MSATTSRRNVNVLTLFYNRLQIVIRYDGRRRKRCEEAKAELALAWRLLLFFNALTLFCNALILLLNVVILVIDVLVADQPPCRSHQRSSSRGVGSMSSSSSRSEITCDIERSSSARHRARPSRPLLVQLYWLCAEVLEPCGRPSIFFSPTGDQR